MELPMQPNKKQKTSWECPVCMESKFPYIGFCGHCVCETCFEKIDTCPVCRKVDAFKNEIPNWDLANNFNLKKEPKKNIFEIVKSDFDETKEILATSHAMLDSINDGVIDFKNLKDLEINMINISKTFKRNYMNAIIPKIVAIYDKKKLNPTKIKLENTIFTSSQMITEIKKRRPDLDNSRCMTNILYIKPSNRPYF